MGDTTAVPPQVTRTDSASITPTPTNPEYAYPRGHYGHLSEREENALVEFKKVLEERGILKPGPPASHDDPLLLYVEKECILLLTGVNVVIAAFFVLDDGW